MPQNETIIETETVIEAGRTESQYWRDLWRFRELFYFLAWRDLITRYKQAAFGVAWAVLRPLLTAIVFTVVFTQIAGLKSDPVPYALFVFAAQIPWQFFANSLTEASNSLIGNSHLISKVYFPRLILPASSLIVCMADLAITVALLALMFVWYRFVPSWHAVFFPLFVLLGGVAALGLGLWMTALIVKYRDFKYITGFVVQFGVYVSPVGYGSDRVPEQWRLLYAANPMVGVIDGVRWSLFGGANQLDLRALGMSLGVTALLLVTGVKHFRRTERSFADEI